MASPVRLLAAGALLAAVVVACSTQPSTAEPPEPTSTQPASTPTTTPALTPTDPAGDPPRWRTDLAAGGRVGNAAPNATVTLPDGTSRTLEELARGKPLLLYFFATW